MLACDRCVFRHLDLEFLQRRSRTWHDGRLGPFEGQSHSRSLLLVCCRDTNSWQIVASEVIQPPRGEVQARV